MSTKNILENMRRLYCAFDDPVRFRVGPGVIRELHRVRSEGESNGGYVFRDKDVKEEDAPVYLWSLPVVVDDELDEYGVAVDRLLD